MSRLLQTISEWKIEAAREDQIRYFFEPDMYRPIERGEKYFVLGRKGTGKTAISEHIYAKSTHDIFTQKVNFKNFPFRLMYSLSDGSYNNPHQFVSMWKFFILAQIARQMTRNHNIDPDTREILGARFGGGEHSTRKLLGKQFQRSFGINIFGLGGVNYSNSTTPSPDKWYDVIDDLEEKILENIDDSSYYILFDSLDEDYKNILNKEMRENYLALIAGLFKAVDDIKNTFDKNNVFPIIFLRDDIFDLISDSDRNKWDDVTVNLNWRKDSIQRLLAFRIARSGDKDAVSENFQAEWAKIFSNERVHYGGEKFRIFDFMITRSYMRPRDLVYYVKECASIASQKGLRRIDPNTVFHTREKYSQHLKKEFRDEMHPIVPDIDVIFEIIGKVCRSRATFMKHDLLTEIADYKDKGLIDPNYPVSPDLLLRYLFYFSFLGNKSGRRSYFRYRRPNTVIDTESPITLHAGLYKAFNVD